MIFKPSLYASILAVIVNVVCCYLFMFYFKFGVRYDETSVLFIFIFTFSPINFHLIVSCHVNPSEICT